MTTDHLGSARVITNENGAVSSRRDYTAFGEESITAERAAGLGYTSSQNGVRKGYTGYEKDIESGLDFAQARYYNSAHGRFTSIDPLTASMNVKNPQTLNRYSYVLNSPYKYVDPLGLIPVSTGGSGGCSAEYSSCDENGVGIGVDEHSSRIYQEQIARLQANQAFARGNTKEGWRIIRESEGALMALDQNGSAVQDPNEPTVTVEATVDTPVDNNISGDDQIVGPFVIPEDVIQGLLNGDYRSLGNGECAQLPQVLLDGKMGLANTWIGLQAVTDFENGPPRGTVIATVNDSKEYPNKATGNHVAIFLNFVKTEGGRFGMRVINQWGGLLRPKVSTIYFPPPNTPLPKVPSAAAIVDGRTYWVVYRRIRK